MNELMLATNIDELDEIARQLISKSKPHTFFALYGEMGAGKTTLIKSLCKQLGVDEMVSSPTFSIMNEYMSYNGKSIYHFDFYRIKSETEAFDMGYENYFYTTNYCFVEWSEKIPGLLNLPKASIFIESKDGVRHIRLVTDPSQ